MLQVSRSMSPGVIWIFITFKCKLNVMTRVCKIKTVLQLLVIARYYPLGARHLLHTSPDSANDERHFITQQKTKRTLRYLL